MQVSVENVGTLGRKLTVKLPAERLESQISERIAKLGRTVRLKGFRPGRVPPQVIKQRFGAEVRGEALSEMIGASLREAFEQEKLQPVAQPTIDAIGEPDNGEISYTASFEIMPEFPEIDVSELEIERAQADVTDADIDAMIETLRTQRRHFDVAERASQKGDFVLFEYAASVGDYRFPEKGLERAGAVVGAGTMFESLEQLVTGHSAGDEITDELEFPSDFGNEHLASRKAQVQFHIVKVQEPHLPAVDAAFVKQFGVKSGDIDTFRNDVRANLERELKGALIGRMKGEVIEKLAAAYPDLDVPEVMVDNEARAMVQARIPEGQEPPTEALTAARPMARKRVAAGLLMGEIARAQKIELDRERLTDMMVTIASTYEDPQQVVELYTNDSRMMAGLQNRVMEDQVADWVAEHAKVTDKTLSFDAVMRPDVA